MRALVLEEFGGPLFPRELDVPAIGHHQALVRVRNAGICQDRPENPGRPHGVRERRPGTTHVADAPRGGAQRV